MVPQLPEMDLDRGSAIALRMPRRSSAALDFAAYIAATFGRSIGIH